MELRPQFVVEKHCGRGTDAGGAPTRFKPGMRMPPALPTDPQTDTPYAAARLMVTLALMTIGACGMYIVPVVLPVVQAEFGVAE